MTDHVRDMTLIRENQLLKQKIDWQYQQLVERENFIRKLMEELKKHGWGDFHYTPYGSPQDPEIVALLEEGKIYEKPFVIMQEGNIYERGFDPSGTPPEEAGT